MARNTHVLNVLEDNNLTMNDNLSVATILNNVFQCKGNQETLELAEEQATCFGIARYQMVDLLFEYLRCVVLVNQEEISTLELNGGRRNDWIPSSHHRRWMVLKV